MPLTVRTTMSRIVRAIMSLIVRKLTRRVLPAALMLRKSAVLCLLLVATPLSAKPLTERQVAASVETWLREVITDARAEATVERMEPYLLDGETVGYIAHLVDGGFCLSGANDLVLPVYFYNPRGTYDAADPNLQFILWEIGDRLTTVREAQRTRDPKLQVYQEALAQRALYWEDLAARRIPERQERARSTLDPEQQSAEPDMLVLPFMSTWGQRSPYNDQCPSLLGHPDRPPPPEVHDKVGCVATAMSQIMYYWKWPETGTGSHGHTQAHLTYDDWESTPLSTDPGIYAPWWNGRLEWDASPPAELRIGGDWDTTMYEAARDISDDSAYLAALATLWSRAYALLTMEQVDFSAATYNWDLMQDVHEDGDGVPDDEVAKLCYHAGVAVSMDWGFTVSTSFMEDFAPALSMYFRYDPDAQFESFNIDRMTADLQWLRLVAMRGTRPGVTIGHAWVAYGYDKATDPSRLFMMNFGWNGGSDGWYTHDSVDLGYTAQQMQVIRIAPKRVVRFVGGSAGGDGTPLSPYESIATAAPRFASGATLIFKAGSDNLFAGGSLVLDRPATLKGHDIRILRE